MESNLVNPNAAMVGCRSAYGSGGSSPAHARQGLGATSFVYSPLSPDQKLTLFALAALYEKERDGARAKSESEAMTIARDVIPFAVDRIRDAQREMVAKYFADPIYAEWAKGGSVPFGEGSRVANFDVSWGALFSENSKVAAPETQNFLRDQIQRVFVASMTSDPVTAERLSASKMASSAGKGWMMPALIVGGVAFGLWFLFGRKK